MKNSAEIGDSNGEQRFLEIGDSIVKTTLTEERRLLDEQKRELVPAADIGTFVAPVGGPCVDAQKVDNDLFGPPITVCPLKRGRRNNCKVLSFGIDYDFTVL